MSGDNTLGDGLIQFYSSQGKLMLAQYENINQLLGPTTDWTAPGTHCEFLVRSFLRQHLPSSFALHKGFVYGRRQEGSESKHCPEIDILIHDINRVSPLLQVEDFVIVQPPAARGMIQVKRRMDTSKLREALENVITARKHWTRMCEEQKVIHNQLDVFSAVVFFEEQTQNDGPKPSATYETRIRELLADPADWDYAPDFVGSLKGHCYYRNQYGDKLIRYVACPASHAGHHVAAQVLLYACHEKLLNYEDRRPLGFPELPPAPHLIEIKR